MTLISRWSLLPLVGAAGILAATAGPASATSSTDAKAQKLVASAIVTTMSATSLSIEGTGISSGQQVKIDVTDGIKDAYGTLSYGGLSTSLRRVGTSIFAKGTKGFLEKQGATPTQAAADANKWFQISSTTDASDYDSVDQLLTPSLVLSGLVPSKATGKVTSVKQSSLNGQPVEVVSGTFDGQKASLYVAKHGKPYLLRVLESSTKSGEGTVSLSNFGKAVHTTAPTVTVKE
jgi:transcription antitermination factor NusG